jgi:hypothetical protein
MVEILLLKINHTKNLTGIVFAKFEARSETFADDTTIFKAFHKISGLACNVAKTVVIPIGTNTNKHDISAPNLAWNGTTHSQLGFFIDSQLKNLDINFQKVKEKIQGQIKAWTPYHLSLRGRITIAKIKLTPQLTYIATVLDIDKKNHRYHTRHD